MTTQITKLKANPRKKLVANLKDLLADLESGEVPYIRKVEDLVVVE